MDTRNPNRKEHGATAIQLLVILVPVLFGFIGFAVDLGRLYMVRGELKTAANAMALSAAEHLIGTDQGLVDAIAASKAPIDPASGFANKYDFGGLVIGQTTGSLSSSAPDPVFYSTLQSALSGGDAGGASDSRHARVTLTADAPLVFWRFLPLASEGKVSVAASAVAGVSAPLCTACGIEPLAVGLLDASDTTDFGFVPGNIYTLAYVCNGPPTPVALPNGTGSVQVIPYLLLDRFNTSDATFPDENTQLFRNGANGLPGANTTSGVRSCFSINNATPEVVWADAIPGLCSAAAVPSPVSSNLCGMDARFEPSPSATFSTVCSGIPSVGQLEPAFTQDSDVAEEDTYPSYAGNGRRLITIPIVDTLNPGAMTVQGFRQFLLQPNLNTVTLNAADARGRFLAMYVGTVAPVKQGRFDGCQIASGPGKVVLHD